MLKSNFFKNFTVQHHFQYSQLRQKFLLQISFGDDLPGSTIVFDSVETYNTRSDSKKLGTGQARRMFAKTCSCGKQIPAPEPDFLHVPAEALSELKFEMYKLQPHNANLIPTHSFT